MFKKAVTALGSLIGAGFRSLGGNLILLLITTSLAFVFYQNWILGLIISIEVPFVIFLFLLICYSFAQRGILFALVQEGTAKAIERGKSFDHMVMSYHGFHLNDPRKPWFDPDQPAWEVLPNDWKDFRKNLSDEEFAKMVKTGDRELNDRYDDRAEFEKILGAYWIGIPPFRKVRWYKFEWAELQLKKNGEEEIWSRAEPTNFIFIQDFTYLRTLRQLKTAEMLENWIEYNETIGVNNPYKALYRVTDWLKRTGAATDREAKDHVGTHSYKTLQSEADAENSAKKADFSAPMLALNKKLPDDSGDAPEHERGLSGRYGITIKAAELRKVQLSGEGERLNNEATTRTYRAEQEAKAVRTTGQAEADVVVMRGKAEADSLKARLDVIEAAGPSGLAAAQLDMLVEVSKNPAALIIEANDLGGAAAGVMAKAAANLATKQSASTGDAS